MWHGITRPWFNMLPGIPCHYTSLSIKVPIACLVLEYNSGEGEKERLLDYQQLIQLNSEIITPLRVPSYYFLKDNLSNRNHVPRQETDQQWHLWHFVEKKILCLKGKWPQRILIWNDKIIQGLLIQFTFHNDRESTSSGGLFFSLLWHTSINDLTIVCCSESNNCVLFLFLKKAFPNPTFRLTEVMWLAEVVVWNLCSISGN